MRESSERKNAASSPTARFSWVLFILRNTILLILTLVAAYQLKDSINPGFILPAMACALLLAIGMHFARLRLPVCFLLFLLCILAVRALSFAIFKLAFSPEAISDADFLFFRFDHDFWPAMLPATLCWLFNLLALRFPAFITLEAGLNALLLLLVFSTEAEYNITLFHPTLFALILTLFILLQIAVLMVHWSRRNLRYNKNNRKLSPVFALLTIPLLLLFIFQYWLMQRYNTFSTRNRGGLLESTLFRFDFSKFIKLESEIRISDDLVMLMRKNGPASRILIRRFILSGYSPGKGFFHSEEDKGERTPEIVPDTPLALPDPGFAERDTVDQEYFFVNLDPTSLVALNYPVEIVPLRNWDSSSFLRIYRVSSRVAGEKIPVLLRSPVSQLEAAQQRFYTDFAADESIKALAEEITAGKTTYTARVLAIRDYLRQNYFYSLKPGIAADGNQLHHFLFTSRKGYCSYFAFAMALMCRSLGIPARVSVGFATLPEWEVLNFYEIRANQAHAWVEVFFGERGWLEFDPTSGIIAPGENLGEMNFQLSDELSKLITEILGNQDKLIPETPWEDRERPPFSHTLRRFLRNFRSLIARTWFLILPALYILLILGLKFRHHLFYRLSQTDRSRAKFLFRHGLMFLYNLGWIGNHRESLLEYAERLDTAYNLNLKALTESYLEAVYAPRFSPDSYQRFLRRYATFKSACDKRVHPLLRLAGYLNPLYLMRHKEFTR